MDASAQGCSVLSGVVKRMDGGVRITHHVDF